MLKVGNNLPNTRKCLTKNKIIIISKFPLAFSLQGICGTSVPEAIARDQKQNTTRLHSNKRRANNWGQQSTTQQDKP